MGSCLRKCPIFVSGSREETISVVQAEEGNYDTGTERNRSSSGRVTSQHGRNNTARQNAVNNAPPVTTVRTAPSYQSGQPDRFRSGPQDAGRVVEDLLEQAEVSAGKIRTLSKENERLKEELRRERAEKEKALLRLSETASSKLVDNNPNITDLSDQNRATKLAEQFTELYDNEWTDAYQTLLQNYLDEKAAIKLLLQILKKVSSCSSQMANMDAFKFEETVCGYLQTDNKNEEVKAIMKRFKDGRKRNASRGLGLDKVEEEVRKRLKDDKKIDQVVCETVCKDYIKKCVLLCWLMNINDPPLAFEFGKAGGILQKDLYRSYTKDGETIKFIVWPVLYLHQNGPLLSKGIAQGKKIKKTKGVRGATAVVHPNVDTVESISLNNDDSEEDGFKTPAERQKDVYKLDVTVISQLSSSFPNVPSDRNIALNSQSPSQISTSRTVGAMCSPRPQTSRSLPKSPEPFEFQMGQTIIKPNTVSLAKDGHTSPAKAWTGVDDQNNRDPNGQNLAETDTNRQQKSTEETGGSSTNLFQRPKSAPDYDKKL